MANPEHLAILKQGVKAWNKWREENPKVRPDLSMADLREAYLREADLFRAYLREADLRGADLFWADLRVADLGGAHLSEAYLSGAHLSEAYLSGADLGGAIMGVTSLGNVDLSQAKGLEKVKHSGASTIGIDTIYKSGGNIPPSFLRGAGVPEDFITYMHSLVNNPIEYYSLFISYSAKDQEFAERLHTDLQAQGVRCWFAPHDMKTGDKIRERIDESIRVYDKLLLIISHHSIKSNWVADEVDAAIEKEAKRKKPVLFPIRVDGAVKATRKAWAAKIRRSRHITDFSQWEQHAQYKKALAKLLSDLKTSARG